MKLLVLVLAPLFLFLSACDARDRREEAKPVLKDDELVLVQEKFSALDEEVQLISFTGPDCKTCQEAKTLYEEIAGGHQKVTHFNFDIGENAEEASKYRITYIPAVVIQSGEDVGLRFYGLPIGRELEYFLDTIRRLSVADPDVSAEAVMALKALEVPVNIKIFVTPE